MAVKFDESKYEKSTTEGVATLQYNDKSVFAEGSELDKKALTEAFKYSGEYIAKTTSEAAKVATEIMKKDKDVNKVIIDYPYGPTGSGSVSAVVHREKTYRVVGTDKTVSRPDIGIGVKHPMIKASKSHVKSLQQEMLEALK